MTLDDGKLNVKKNDKNCKNDDASEVLSKTYDLYAIVCYVNDQSSTDKRNLVALLKINENLIDEKSETGRWYLFNDFSICPVPTSEALWYSLDWKVPCVVYYTSPEAKCGEPGVKPLSRDVFNDDTSIIRNGGTGITFTPLRDNEELKAGDLVSMDAEFVTLNQEEAEIRSDGKLSTVKPSQMSVARITCIRG